VEKEDYECQHSRRFIHSKPPQRCSRDLIPTVSTSESNVCKSREHVKQVLLKREGEGGQRCIDEVSGDHDLSFQVNCSGGLSLAWVELELKLLL
jgi:hypothetical protein